MSAITSVTYGSVKLQNMYKYGVVKFIRVNQGWNNIASPPLGYNWFIVSGIVYHSATTTDTSLGVTVKPENVENPVKAALLVNFRRFIAAASAVAAYPLLAEENVNMLVVTDQECIVLLGNADDYANLRVIEYPVKP